MAIFPLRVRPAASYHEHPRCFGSDRESGQRAHAGCDLYCPAGSDVLCAEDGIVLRSGYLFYLGSVAVEVQHASGVILRYCELSEVAPEARPGAAVRAGQVIGKVGRLSGLSMTMLHLEMYTGQAEGPLTDFSLPPYDRRSDLIDPAPFLDECDLWAG